VSEPSSFADVRFETSKAEEHRDVVIERQAFEVRLAQQGSRRGSRCREAWDVGDQGPHSNRFAQVALRAEECPSENLSEEEHDLPGDFSCKVLNVWEELDLRLLAGPARNWTSSRISTSSLRKAVS